MTPGAAKTPVTRVNVTLADFSIRLSTDRVPPGRVLFRVVNQGRLQHGFTVGGRGTRVIAPGKRASLVAVLSKQKPYRFASNAPGDVAVGMTGVLRVGRARGKAKPKSLVTASRLRLRRIAIGLGALTHVASPPGDPHRLMVVRQDGVVMLFKDGVQQDEPFLDLRDVVKADGEQGLLSIAFAPDYATSGTFYVYYTNRDGNIRVSERRRSDTNPDVSDSSRRQVLAVVKQAANHNGGMMQFGPDGLLYISIGDGGANPPTIPVGRSGQNLGDLFGTIIRIDPRAATPYAVPPGNPFVSLEGARPEIVAYGLRNPWRFWIDRATNTMLIGDVGEGSREEVNRLPLDRLGLNFGWPCEEGSVVPPDVPIPAGCSGAQPTRPVYQYPHTKDRCSITGGVVARDPRIRALDGLYLWGDLCQGRIHAVTSTGKLVPLDLEAQLPTSFGTDAAGRVYVTTANGALYRLDVAS